MADESRGFPPTAVLAGLAIACCAVPLALAVIGAGSAGLLGWLAGIAWYPGLAALSAVAVFVVWQLARRRRAGPVLPHTHRRAHHDRV